MSIPILREESYIDKNMRRRPCKIGLCTCGTEVVLIDEYQGATSCHKCKQWYNIFGQALRPPAEWQD
jgi:hypothetical protein